MKGGSLVYHRKYIWSTFLLATIGTLGWASIPRVHAGIMFLAVVVLFSALLYMFTLDRRLRVDPEKMLPSVYRCGVIMQQFGAVSSFFIAHRLAEAPWQHVVLLFLPLVAYLTGRRFHPLLLDQQPQHLLMLYAPVVVLIVLSWAGLDFEHLGGAVVFRGFLTTLMGVHLQWRVLADRHQYRQALIGDRSERAAEARLPEKSTDQVDLATVMRWRSRLGIIALVLIAISSIGKAISGPGKDPYQPGYGAWRKPVYASLMDLREETDDLHRGLERDEKTGNRERSQNRYSSYRRELARIEERLRRLPSPPTDDAQTLVEDLRAASRIMSSATEPEHWPSHPDMQHFFTSFSAFHARAMNVLHQIDLQNRRPAASPGVSALYVDQRHAKG
jgi:hypothetical protein